LNLIVICNILKLKKCGVARVKIIKRQGVIMKINVNTNKSSSSSSREKAERSVKGEKKINLNKSECELC
jgi:hypothetical protein